jgi:hypothetical protein
MSKFCANCSTWKLKSNFYGSAESGHQGYCKECSRARHAEAWRAARRKAVAIYGDACAVCGVDSEASRLEFDHVNNDGKQHRTKEQVTQWLWRVARTGQKLTEYEIQLLCVEHHKAKTAQHRAALKAAA